MYAKPVSCTENHAHVELREPYLGESNMLVPNKFFIVAHELYGDCLIPEEVRLAVPTLEEGEDLVVIFNNDDNPVGWTLPESYERALRTKWLSPGERQAIRHPMRDPVTTRPPRSDK